VPRAPIVAVQRACSFQGFAKGPASFTAVLNLIGLPAASLPMGRTQAGLPMGLQIVGGPFAERDVLALSWELEEAMPWQTIAPLGAPLGAPLSASDAAGCAGSHPGTPSGFLGE
jgi:Asp-tRNA(Asn)/Glu-tRNA(Gln) amidotransferase A subunit family amidase